MSGRRVSHTAEVLAAHFAAAKLAVPLDGSLFGPRASREEIESKRERDRKEAVRLLRRDVEIHSKIVANAQADIAEVEGDTGVDWVTTGREPAIAASLLTDSADLQEQVARLLAYATHVEILAVLGRIEEYRLAWRPKHGEPRLVRAVQVALDSVVPFAEEARQ